MNSNEVVVVHDSVVVNSEQLNSNMFWGDFDVKHAKLQEVTEYILSHKKYDNCCILENEKRDHYLIYMIVNNITKRIYIGQHRTKNVNDSYMGSGCYIIKSQEKYGIENFTKIILFDFDNYDDMNNMEISIVTKEFTSRKFTYNRAIGGIGSSINRLSFLSGAAREKELERMRENGRRQFLNETPEKRAIRIQKARERRARNNALKPKVIKQKLPKIKKPHKQRFSKFREEAKIKNDIELKFFNHELPFKNIYREVIYINRTTFTYSIVDYTVRMDKKIWYVPRFFTKYIGEFFKNEIRKIEPDFDVSIKSVSWLRIRYLNACSRSEERRSVVERYTFLYNEYLKHDFNYVKDTYKIEDTFNQFRDKISKYAKGYENGKRRHSSCSNRIDLCSKMYVDYVEHGLDYVKEKYSLPQKKVTIIKMFKQYLKEYNPEDRRRAVFRQHVEKYTKIYEYYKLFGYESTKEKFDLTIGKHLLQKYFRDFVEEYKSQIRDKTDSEIKRDEMRIKMFNTYFDYMMGGHTYDDTMKEFNLDFGIDCLRANIKRYIPKERIEQYKEMMNGLKDHDFEKNVVKYTEIYEEYKISGYKGCAEKFDIDGLNSCSLRRKFVKYVKEFRDKFDVKNHDERNTLHNNIMIGTK